MLHRPQIEAGGASAEIVFAEGGGILDDRIEQLADPAQDLLA